MKAKLSMAFQDLRGKDGTVVIKNSRQGLIVTPHVTPKNSRTAAQMFVRGNLTKASRTFEGLNPTQVQAWENYANTLSFEDPLTGKSYHPTAIAAFIQLATKFLQLNPSGTIPVTPPTTAFAGDTITVSYSEVGTGTLEFEASAANAAGVTTEILVQRLPNGHWTPQSNAYRHAAWKAFTSGSLSLTVPESAGVYATGYRFVKNSTGQMTEPQYLPIQSVGFELADGGQKLKKAA